METLSDLDLINNIKKQKNTDESLQELINRHSGIYIDIVNSFLKNSENSSLREDIIKEKDRAIYDSALRFCEDRGAKFSTFLGNEAKWACLNASNKNKKYLELKVDNFNFENIEIPKSSDEDFNQQILKDFDDELKNHPDKRVQKIFKMRYSGTKKKLTPWKKISQQLNLSIQGCINIHNAALKNISKTIKSKYDIISKRAN